jgi:hypothetical protein
MRKKLQALILPPVLQKLSVVTAVFVCAMIAHAQLTTNISTVAGNGSGGFSGDGGPATSAEMFIPIGIAVDSSNNIYIADSINNCIRKVTASTGNISTVAGSATGGFAGDGGAATSAELESPEGVAVDSSGNLYIADTGNQRIREVTASTGIIAVVPVVRTDFSGS